MSAIEAIRRANQPGPPEDSIRLRAAAAATILVGIAACSAESELSRPVALVSAVLILTGMTFSYLTRKKPPGYVKVLAAVGAVSLLAWFVEALSGGQITDITTVEDPLSVLFVGIQVVHSFHVPARRDLIFTIAGGAGLVALAGAQSIDLSFAYYAVPWLCLTLWALVELWRSASDGGQVAAAGVAWSVGGVCAATFLVFLLLPAPTVGVRVGFISRPGNGGLISTPGALAGDSGGASQLSRAGTRAGATRVGGYLGFANHLDTALRGDLGRTLIMRVRAQLPTFWIGETFDRWDGENWISTVSAKESLRGGSPFYVPVADENLPAGQPDLQTFYVVNSSPNLVFHAGSAREIWFPSSSLRYGLDGTVVSPLALGRGAVYTVESDFSDPTPAQLRSASGFAPDLIPGFSIYTQLPHPYPRVDALAESVTAGATNPYDKVEALIAWMGGHTRYSTDIPPLPSGADTVDQFLFGNRVGFCEQISTALAVMLRSLGIPAREAVGYVPGDYNPVTDLYDVRAQDAHAWVQVWFPGYGWQSFDPTAAVPLANPSPGGTALKDIGRALARVPVGPTGAAIGGIGSVYLASRWRRARPRTWDAIVLRQMERTGRRCGRQRRSSETLLEYAAALDAAAAAQPRQPEPIAVNWSDVASVLAGVAYGGAAPSPDTRRRLLEDSRKLRAATPTRSRSIRRPRGGTGR